MSLSGHMTAILIGVVAGVLLAYSRRGMQTGDGMPFSGK